MVELNANAGNFCGEGGVATIDFTQNPFLNRQKGCGNSKFITIYEGTINIPEAGQYEFALDGGDAVDFSVNGYSIAFWYGSHNQCSNTVSCQCNTHTGQVYLSAGTHYVRFRHQTWTRTSRAVLRTRLVKPASTRTNYAVRARVCDPAAGLEANCRVYPAGTYKPIGLLQSHGEDERMLFGLLSGSWTHPYNMRGGVLRENIWQHPR